MNNMHKMDPDEVVKKHEVVLLHDAYRHQALVKANRVLLMLVLALMSVVFLLGFWIVPDVELVEQSSLNTSSTAQALENPVLSAEINTLKSQMVGLVSGSIESKLRVLEQSVRTGHLKASLGTINDLKNDVRVLRNYSQTGTTNAPDYVKPQLDAQLIQELSQLKFLIYLTLASCGLMISAIAGLWLRNRYLLNNQTQKYIVGKK